ncbi:flagellin [Evansella cellulosilytica]|uniref:Flagellin n=1 Tax=Evansella cellulosilytica (strain ATCC 21833 / DSM 2522 / FERM P-1141 / JCM 9156 / N-4) TaxID=649639 RepID=E6TS91_EVAC2|nr:flagellin [Evansella cellulosilytica]ADU31860.1 flagellin domain protein [Evansella cellulosilytica DSM 2522]
MIINNNIPALNTFRQMGANQNAMQNSMEKLSSGLRINRAGDDAAGLAISEKMRAQIRGLDQASRNAQDGISMIQTAEGALQETQNILQRMRELATQAANDTNVGVDRNEIQKEINELTSEINRIANTTEFNTQPMLNVSGAGGAGFSSTFQIGANQGQSMTIEIKSMTAESLGLQGGSGANATAGASISALNTGKGAEDVTGAKFAAASGVSNGTSNNKTAAGLSVANHTEASASIQVINNAIEAVSAQRSNLGSFQNRLEHTISNLDNSSENLQAAESRIRDVDMAREVMQMTKNNILSQASQSMLAQANQQPQSVLQLLG